MTNEELEGKLRALEDGSLDLFLAGRRRGKLAWASEVATRARAVASLRASGPARVRLVDGTALVRVTLAPRGGGQGSRTVTVGLDVFSQLAGDLLQGVPPHAVLPASEALRDALREPLERISDEVSRRSDALLADPEKVASVKAEIVGRREKQRRTERENLVSTMSHLLSAGWTRDLLVEAVNESVCRNVMSS